MVAKMIGLARRIKRRLFKPAVLKRMVVEGTRQPRTRAGAPPSVSEKVFLIREPKDLNNAFHRIDAVWEAGLAEIFSPGQKVLIKVNLNTADPYPGSTCPHMLAALIDFLHKKNIRNIKVGDCSAICVLPTRKVLKQLDILDTLSNKAEMVLFDQEPWVRVPIQGRYLEEVTVPKIAMEADRIISLANLKTHHRADFTFGLKLSVGFMHPLERISLHRDHLREKIPEISLALGPDLTIIDGRTAFVTGGPNKGRAEPGDIILMGLNPLNTDVEAYRQLYLLKAQHGCEEAFHEDPFEMVQLRHARSILLRGKGWKDYERIEI